MIKGIGLDMTQISRVEKACINEHFVNRIYSDEEIRCFRKFPVRLAGNFAVKEAVAKAFGTGFRGIQPSEIEVLRDELGCPYVNLYGKAAEIRQKMQIQSIWVTITNEGDYVSASVILEG